MSPQEKAGLLTGAAAVPSVAVEAEAGSRGTEDSEHLWFKAVASLM